MRPYRGRVHSELAHQPVKLCLGRGYWLLLLLALLGTRAESGRRVELCSAGNIGSPLDRTLSELVHDRNLDGLIKLLSKPIHSALKHLRQVPPCALGVHLQCLCAGVVLSDSEHCGQFRK